MKRIALVLALLAVAGLASASPSAPRPRPNIAGILIGDTVFVRGTWRSVDARGNPVAQYNYRYLRNGIEAATGTTPDTMVVRPFARPLAGDTAEYVIEVVAVDVRGVASAAGRSPVLRVITPWSAPNPPTVTIDTLLIAGTPDPAVYPWNYDSLTAYLMGGIRVGNADQGERPVEFTYLTQTVEVCYLAWYGSNAEVPRFRVAGTTNDPETLRVEAIPQRSDCLAVTALKPTQLGFSGDAAAYRRALP